MFCFRFLVHLRQSWKKLSRLPNKTGVWLLQLLLGILIKVGMHEMSTQLLFYCYFLNRVFPSFVWPPITQHGWQTHRRGYGTSQVCLPPPSQPDSTQCADSWDRRPAVPSGFRVPQEVSCLKGVSILQSIVSLYVLPIKHLIFSWWILQHLLYSILHPLLNSHCINTSARSVATVIASVCVIYVCRFHARFTAPALGEMKHLSPLTLVDPRTLFNQWRHNSQHHYHPSNRTQYSPILLQCALSANKLKLFTTNNKTLSSKQNILNISYNPAFDR